MQPLDYAVVIVVVGAIVALEWFCRRPGLTLGRRVATRFAVVAAVLIAISLIYTGLKHTNWVLVAAATVLGGALLNVRAEGYRNWFRGFIRKAGEPHR